MQLPASWLGGLCRSSAGEPGWKPASSCWCMGTSPATCSCEVMLELKGNQRNAVKKTPHNKSTLTFRGFPGGTVVKNPPANAGDTGSSPGPGRSHMPWSS